MADKVEKPEKPDKLWHYRIRVFREESTNKPGTKLCQLRGDLTTPGDSYPSAYLIAASDKVKDPSIFDELNAAAARKIAKFGMMKVQPSEPTVIAEFFGTNIPDGVTRKIHRIFLKGLDALVDFGEKEAKAKGRSSEHDWDDDGKPHKKPHHEPEKAHHEVEHKKAHHGKSTE